MLLKDIAKEFRIDECLSYRIVLWFSNKNRVRILETPESLFSSAGEEILKTKSRLLSSEFVWEEAASMKSTMIPFAKGCYLYFLYENDSLLYIGQTVLPPRRIGDHVKDKNFTHVAIKSVPSTNIDILELINIYYYDPPLNRVGRKDGCLLDIVLSYCSFDGESGCQGGGFYELT